MVKYKGRNYERGKGDEIDENYARLVNYVVSHVKEEERDGVARILMTGKAQEAYEVMSDDGMDSGDIKNVMLKSLRSLARGKGISPAGYLSTVAMKLGELEESEDAIEHMYEKKMISERTYHSALGEIKEKHKSHVHRGKSGLEAIARKAAAIVLLLTGAIVGITSQFTLTGSAIGWGMSPTITLVISILMFILGVLVYPRS